MSVFKAVLSAEGDEKLRVLEWGSGRSTIYYPKYLRSIGREFDWHAVDNSRGWYDRGLKKLRQAGLAGQVHLYCAEFPAFWELPGYSISNPATPPSFADNPNVIEYINLPKELGIQFDVIIVDGRFRRRCLLVAKEVLAPKGTVILHDADRSHYHSSLSAFLQVRFLETGTEPVSGEQSTIALCSLDEGSPLEGIVREFSGRQWMANEVRGA